MRKIYIAGPMRGLPMLNFPEFFRAEALWRAAGWDVVNPAQMDQDNGQDPALNPDIEKNGIDFAEAMSRDLPAVASCDAIALMSGWEKSVGANTELRHAVSLNKEVYDANTLELYKF
jgi:hypothetical protein